MIRTLLGLTQPTSGDVSLLGLPQPAKRAEALARVGAIVEEPKFHPHLTGRENLKIIAAARDRATEARIPQSLERVGLAHRANDRVKAYSLGMRQRLGIARCLIADPALLILDEPMNGLDPAGILEMRHLIRAFVAEGRTVFLSSHLLDEVEKTCDQVAIVDQGRIVLQGAVDEIAATGDPTVLIEVDDVAAARRVLDGRAIEEEGTALRVKLSRRAHRCGDQQVSRRGRARRVEARAGPRDARGEVPRDHVETGRQRMRLVGAEVLKLVRRRGLMAWSLLLTIGSVLVAEIVLVVLHAVNASHHGPAGGTENFKGVILLLTGLGTVAAILIGATAGTQDVANGVFRDLVVTGRKRATLFNVRVPGALLVYLPMLALGFGIALAVAFAFSGSLATPSGSGIAKYGEYALAITGINIVMAIGLASFASSRVVVGVLIAWNAIVSHILISLSVLGGSRKLVDVAAAEHFLPREHRQHDRRHVDVHRAARARRLGLDLSLGRTLVDEPRRRLAVAQSAVPQVSPR